eukprot:snap_masked-scaffold_1-processed-gene-24.33-mRNA-1 protein AED:1.00 eAED:1.00 QI:0/0/0/0/1/1/3/0/769
MLQIQKYEDTARKVLARIKLVEDSETVTPKVDLTANTFISVYILLRKNEIRLTEKEGKVTLSFIETVCNEKFLPLLNELSSNYHPLVSSIFSLKNILINRNASSRLVDRLLPTFFAGLFVEIFSLPLDSKNNHDTRKALMIYTLEKVTLTGEVNCFFKSLLTFIKENNLTLKKIENLATIFVAFKAESIKFYRFLLSIFSSVEILFSDRSDSEESFSVTIIINTLSILLKQFVKDIISIFIEEDFDCRTLFIFLKSILKEKIDYTDSSIKKLFSFLVQRTTLQDVDVRKQSKLTYLMVYSLQQLRLSSEDFDFMSNSLVDSFSSFLDSQVKEIRINGMLIHEAVYSSAPCSKLEKGPEFEELQIYKKHQKFSEQSYFRIEKEIQEFINGSIVYSPRKSKENPAKYIKKIPFSPWKDFEGENPQFESDSDDDSEADFEPTIEAEKSQRNLILHYKLHFIPDYIQAFTEYKENDMKRYEVALYSLPEKIKRKPIELNVYGVELGKVLFELQDRFKTKEFPQKRLECLVNLTTAIPTLMADVCHNELFGPQQFLLTRRTSLQVLYLSAVQLSSMLQIDEENNDELDKRLIDVAAAGNEGKSLGRIIRRKVSRAVPFIGKQSFVENKFTPVAKSFILPLLRQVDTMSLIFKEPQLLAQLISTLSVMLQTISEGYVAVQLMKECKELFWTFRDSKETEVRRASIHALVVLFVGLQSSLKFESDNLTSNFLWEVSKKMQEVRHLDPDFHCRDIAENFCSNVAVKTEPLYLRRRSN